MAENPDFKIAEETEPKDPRTAPWWDSGASTDSIGNPDPGDEDDAELSVVPFAQGDPAWAGEIMQTAGKTIGGWGCALCSSAAVFNCYGANTNPKQLNYDIGDYACEVNWYYYAQVGSQGRAAFDDTYSFEYGALARAIQNGYAPIVKFEEPGTAYRHSVVVYKVYGTGNIPDDYWIADSAGGVKSKFTDYTNQGKIPVRFNIYLRK